MSKLFSLRSGFVKNVTTLVTGTAISQAINFLSTPLLTRIYTPEEFAVFQIFYSTASIIAVIATLRYELAIVAPSSEEEAIDLVSVSFYLSFLIAFISLCVAAIAHFFMGEVFNIWYYLIPVYVVFAGLMQSLNLLSIRRKTYKRNMTSRIGTALSTAIVGIVTGFFGLRPAGLILGSVSGQLMGFLLLMKEIPAIVWRPFHRKHQLLQIAAQHSNYPKFNAPHALVDTIQDQGLVYLLNFYFSASIVSFYGQAFRILKAPIGFIGSAIYQVVLPQFTEMSRSGIDLRSPILKIYIRMFIIGLPAFGFLFFYAEPIFGWFFGENWTKAGTIAGYMAPWLFLNFMASPVSCITLIRNKQRKAFMITLTEISLRFIAVGYGGFMGSSDAAFMLLSLAGSAVMLYALIWYYRMGAPDS
jgi:O-antigen/teichoic acid export membrane protein